MFLLAALFGVVPIVVGACGSSDTTSATLPPIVTTTSTTSTIAPSTTVPTEYVIQSGDSLQKIAAQFGVSVEDLIALNGITNPDEIEAGATLKIPAPGTPAPPPVTLAITTTTG